MSSPKSHRAWLRSARVAGRDGGKFLRKKAGYLGSEAAGVPGGVGIVEKGRRVSGPPGCNFGRSDLRKKRQSQSLHRNGLTDSLAKKASKNPLDLDLRVRSL